MTHFAVHANTDSTELFLGVSNATAQEQQWALEGAIWHFVYAHYGPGSGYQFINSDPKATALYNAFVSAAELHTAANDRSKVYWINPHPYGNGFAQAQVGFVQSVPEPSSFALMGLGGLSLAFRAYRRRIGSSTQ